MRVRIKATGQTKTISNEQGKKLVEKGEAEIVGTIPQSEHSYNTRKLTPKQSKTK